MNLHASFSAFLGTEAMDKAVGFEREWNTCRIQVAAEKAENDNAKKTRATSTVGLK